ncbi:MAG: hypothetical protein ACYC5M_14735 [Anaerolineae bacterium]
MYRTLRIGSTTRITNDEGFVLSPREVPEAIQRLLTLGQPTPRPMLCSVPNKPKASKR